MADTGLAETKRSCRTYLCKELTLPGFVTVVFRQDLVFPRLVMSLLKMTLNSRSCCSPLPSVDSTGTSCHSELDTVLGLNSGPMACSVSTLPTGEIPRQYRNTDGVKDGVSVATTQDEEHVQFPCSGRVFLFRDRVMLHRARERNTPPAGLQAEHPGLSLLGQKDPDHLRLLPSLQLKALFPERYFCFSRHVPDISSFTLTTHGPSAHQAQEHDKRWPSRRCSCPVFALTQGKWDLFLSSLRKRWLCLESKFTFPQPKL